MSIMTFQTRTLASSNSAKNSIWQIGQNRGRSLEQQPEMSPEKNADILSDKLMMNILAQFEAIKLRFEASKNLEQNQMG